MLITQAEIKRLKTNPRQLSWKDVERGYKPVEQIKIKSGYLVGYSIDSIYVDEPHVKLRHVTIRAKDFEPDPADMDTIARLILGDCFRIPAEWGFSVTHYIQAEGMDTEDFKQFRKDGIESGVAVIETGKG